ncbi:MAG TPA: PP2C family protein-serine/threonine phosphatase [Acidimicrobiales bacterium]
MNGLDLSSLVPRLAAAEPSQLVPTLDRFLATCAWYRGVRLLVPDHGDRVLVDPHGDRRPIAIEGPLADAYRSCDLVLAGAGADAAILVPLRMRADCVGILEVRADGVPGEADLATVAAIGHIVGLVLWAGRNDMEFVERCRRLHPMSLSAEIQWDLLSSRVETGFGYAAAGWMEPAYDVGGDTFDLAVDVGVLWVSSIDAMGHGLEAGVASGVALSAIRNARRTGGGVADQAAAVNEALLRLWQGERFATLLLLRLDVATGEVEAVNAGHPLARRVRRGNVDALGLAVDVPPGLTGTATYRAQRFRLEPGDRIVAASDGVAGAAIDGGVPYGADRIDRALAEWHDLAPAHLVRTLAWQVLSHAGDRLRDDATIVCVDWGGGDGA